MDSLRITVSLLGLLMVLAVLAPSPAAASAGTTEARSAQGGIGSSIRLRTLSNEVSVTKFAFARRGAAIHNGPRPGSRTTGRLEFRTSDGRPLPYIALTNIKETPGQSWTEIRIPARPNAQTGWVRAKALGHLYTAHGRLVINRRELRATLYGREGRIRWQAPVGIGKPGHATPRGHFLVTERLRGIGGAAFGPFAFGTSAFASHPTDWPGGEVIGIHGTNQPGLIPGRPSAGNIRLRNPDIRILWRKLEVGTPILIR